MLLAKDSNLCLTGTLELMTLLHVEKKRVEKKRKEKKRKERKGKERKGEEKRREEKRKEKKRKEKKRKDYAFRRQFNAAAFVVYRT